MASNRVNCILDGNEFAEIKLLKERLGWARAMEVGKPPPPTRTLPANETASRCIGRPIHGDVAVIRSGPEHSNDYSEIFSREELLRTSEFYRRNEPHERFAKQERTRISAMFGGIPGLANILHIVI